MHIQTGALDPSVPPRRRRLALLPILLLAGLVGACQSESGDLSGTAGMPGVLSVRGITRGQPRGGGSEVPVAGASVVLWKAGKDDGPCDQPVASTSSAADGAYSFNAEPGRYCVGADESHLSEPFILDSTTGDQVKDITLP